MSDINTRGNWVWSVWVFVPSSQFLSKSKTDLKLKVFFLNPYVSINKISYVLETCIM